MSGHNYGAFSELPGQEPFPGVNRNAFSSAHSTVTSYNFEPGGTFPIHRHPEEQVTLILEGTVHFTVDGVEHKLGPGEWSVIDGGIEHGITAGADGARFIAIVSPARQRSDQYEVVGSE